MAASSLLPHDLVLEILCRLGVKDLLRFRCVSKPFCSSIDDPDFIDSHLSHSLETNANCSFIFRCNERNNNLLRWYLYSVDLGSPKKAQKLNHPLDEPYGDNFIYILGSCNGLLALGKGVNEVSLFNPSTRRFQMLPSTQVGSRSGLMIIGGFRSRVFGLGYDRNSDDYKLVRIIQYDVFDSEVMVYSLRTDSWRRMKDFPFCLVYRVDPGVFSSNALHWIVCKNPESETRRFIAALDLDTEEYSTIELPDHLDEGFHLSLKAMGGFLYLTGRDSEESQVVDIWMMEEYGVKESWTKLISLKPSESDFQPAFVVMPRPPMAFSKIGEKLMLDRNGNRFGWYDMRSKISYTLSIEGLPPMSFGEAMLVESLVPLGPMINKNKRRGTENMSEKNTTKRRPVRVME